MTWLIKNTDYSSMDAEVGYELLPEFQGKGYMQNALEKILFFAFIDLELTTIEAFTHRENLKSRSLLERNKFTLIADKTDPDFSENVFYRLIKYKYFFDGKSL